MLGVEAAEEVAAGGGVSAGFLVLGGRVGREKEELTARCRIGRRMPW